MGWRHGTVGKQSCQFERGGSSEVTSILQGIAETGWVGTYLRGGTWDGDERESAGRVFAMKEALPKNKLKIWRVKQEGFFASVFGNYGILHALCETDIDVAPKRNRARM
jgi:hypothetical protein